MMPLAERIFGVDRDGASVYSRAELTFDVRAGGWRCGKAQTKFLQY